MSTGPITTRLREHDRGPRPQDGELVRAGELIRAVSPPPPLTPAADARILAALRGAGAAPLARRLAMPLAAVVAIVAGGFASAGLGRLREPPRPAIVPLPQAPPRPAGPVVSLAPPLAPAPAPAPERSSARLEDLAAPEGRGDGSGFVRARLAIDPGAAAFRVPLPEDLARPRSSYAALVTICVSPAGEVTGVTIRQGAHKRLDRAIAATMRRWRYTPALRNGVAVRSCFDLRYHIDVPAAADPR
jgi:TonB family protein